MPQWAVHLGRVVVGAVPHLVQLVVAGSAVAQVVHVVVGGVTVVVADLRAIRPGANECLGHEGVNVVRLVLALGVKAYKRVSSPFAESRAQHLTLVAVNPAVGAGDGAVNAANPPVATNFVDSLIPVDGFPAFNGRLFVVHDSPLLWSWACPQLHLGAFSFSVLLDGDTLDGIRVR